ncbi:glycosyl transferase [Nitrosospira lacus]|uniref:Glycosyl transferase n=1 Tax=Nitrosospira lacus TaxID=1288494 RepID=A0A1W6SN50_9PROT|nr:glycosyltransferase family 4 protein [Nitrosospira lacus]ARO87225.1 glycosyl transferase [Nitrosospira lacus]
MIDGLSFSLLTPPLIAFTVTLILTGWLIKNNVLKVLDHPNPRSLHTRAVRRTGGLGMMLGVAISWASIPAALPISVSLGVALLVLVSFADDIFGLPVLGRLLMHGAVAIWFSVALLSEARGWMVATIITISVVWMINLYNFMDGSDGLAGGMTLIGFTCYGLTALLAGNESFAVINFCIAAAAAAFLIFNFYPARIFMGDAGAIPLGFLAASLGMIGWTKGLWPPWLPVLVFSPFIADASVTLAKRCLSGEKFWQAHRAHYYQRMVRSGLGHRNTALLGYILMVSAGVSAMWAAHEDIAVQLGVGIVWGGIYLSMMIVSERYLERCPGD